MLSIRGHILTEDSIPQKFTSVLGHSQEERLNTLVHDIIHSSEDKNDILMTKEVEQAMFSLRRFLFQSVYTNKIAKSQEHKAEQMLEQLFFYYLETTEMLPEEYRFMIEEQKETRHRIVCDYVAGMTDHYAIAKYQEAMVPASWDVY